VRSQALRLFRRRLPGAARPAFAGAAVNEEDAA
jgi:hypothetical protein